MNKRKKEINIITIPIRNLYKINLFRRVKCFANSNLLFQYARACFKLNSFYGEASYLQVDKTGLTTVSIEVISFNQNQLICRCWFILHSVLFHQCGLTLVHFLILPRNFPMSLNSIKSLDKNLNSVFYEVFSDIRDFLCIIFITVTKEMMSLKL